MSTPTNTVNKKFGDIFVSRTKNLKINSSEKSGNSISTFTVFSGRVNTGTTNPTAVSIIVPGDQKVGNGRISDFNWSSIHVRTYRDLEEMTKAGIPADQAGIPQKLTVGSCKNNDNFSIVSVESSDTTKVYSILVDKNDDGDDIVGSGKLTVHVQAPNIPGTGNNLPRKSTLLAMLNEENFTFEK